LAESCGSISARRLLKLTANLRQEYAAAPAPGEPHRPAVTLDRGKVRRSETKLEDRNVSKLLRLWGLTMVSAWLLAGCSSPKKIDVGGTAF